MSPSAARSGSGRPPVEREFSAGGVVVRGDDVVVIVPRGRDVLALPKGNVDSGESAADAAAREIMEETGISAQLVDKLGDVRYWYQRGGKRISKTVSFFLFEHRAGDGVPDAVEIEAVRWLPLDDALTELSYPGEREMIERALSRSAPDR